MSNQRTPTINRVLVTPEMAERWLTKNRNIRAIDNHHVQKMLSDMISGNWRDFVDPIRFGLDGYLIDGQHRLTAIARFGQPVWVWVVNGIDSENALMIDTGEKPRSLGNQLTARGVSNAAQVGSTIAWYCKFTRGANQSEALVRYITPTLTDALSILAAHPGLVESYKRTHSRRGIRQASMVAAFIYIADTVDSAKCAEFFEAVATGLGLTDTHPAYHYRNKANPVSMSRNYRYTPNEMAALLVKAWRLFYLDRPCTRLTWTFYGTKAELFPSITDVREDA
jgi:hypothetical protein